jgi:hypothetical protein
MTKQAGVGTSLVKRARELGLEAIAERLPARAALFEFQDALPPVRAPVVGEFDDTLASLARLGPVASVVEALLGHLEHRAGEAAWVARDLLGRGLFEEELRARLYQAAGLAGGLALDQLPPPGESALQFCSDRIGSLTHWESEEDLQRLVEQGSLGAVTELLRLDPRFSEFLHSDAGRTFLHAKAQLYHLARLPSLAVLFAQLALEISPSLASLTLVCEIALDANIPGTVGDRWFEQLGAETRDLRTYCQLRAAMEGDRRHFAGPKTPGHRSAVPLIDLGIAAGSDEFNLELLRKALAADPTWRYARSILVEAEARRAEGDSLVPFDELRGYVESLGNDFWTWQKPWAVSPPDVITWKAMSMRLLGRELAASPDHADLWRVMLSSLCPEDEYRAGLEVIAGRLREQQGEL